MSDVVPELAADEDKPYCIWYPDVASEDTYRQLVKRYPDMRYTIGRACAVAGYATLYHELDLLPEVSIAEEARDNSTNDGSKTIFDAIMKQPACYAILNDYTRSCNIDNPLFPAFMNSDTAVQSSLDIRLGLDKYKKWCDHYFNIAEDFNVGEVSSEKTNRQTIGPEHVGLFYTPLLSHLPTTNKDPLIIMAAYEGNIERYVRLRRPVFLHDEGYAIVRGIYHNTTFAKWWSIEVKRTSPEWDSVIEDAVLARFIMVNDLSHITPVKPTLHRIPHLIWWPLIPAEATLRELLRRRPEAKLQVAMACIAGDYRRLWDELAPEPQSELMDQARQDQLHPEATPHWPRSPNRNYYVGYLEQKAKELKVPVPRSKRSECEDAAVRDKEPTSTWLDDEISAHPYALVNSYPGGSVYQWGSQAIASHWELLICSSEAMRRKAQEEGGLRLYDDEMIP
ncbi:uncharacterized protein ColSpa_08675 [Colletotrichum spaethianum]|uniref:Uncharacterized protein n=1 Tax=Colletotrichum spaethianum TaxID=700344 RepID=A0AA37UIR5_9PEZI|nr:uncharacterized protein ColSpa_08675 [Colletotrichum spaethianum]GKT48494.1 hypothetical protein ColSpa_08675 [Colletotrichum spaethianum]